VRVVLSKSDQVSSISERSIANRCHRLHRKEEGIVPGSNSQITFFVVIGKMATSVALAKPVEERENDHEKNVADGAY
jgi:hypothetical protein